MTSGALFPQTDTIVAPATAAGVAAISIIRLSGPEAIAIADKLYRGKKLEDQPSHTLHFGLWTNEKGEPVDEVVISLFKAPASYTGENVVEISCHGSPIVVEQIIHSCLSQNARLAEPGEFTRRAFLNGKMDLTQAEAVADLIASQSKAAHHSALQNLRGGFSQKLKSLRQRLIEFAALMELELDFSQEDVEFADRSQLYALIDEAEGEVSRLVDSFSLGNAVKNGVSVAIVGKPNSGKSTLLNALLNEERAIVSEIAGTTRDTIEEVLNIKGILFRLIDTAGIREHTTDTIERVGVGRSLEKMRGADVVVYLFDVQDAIKEIRNELQKLDKEQINYLAIGNKADLTESATLQEKFSGLPEILFISAKERSGIDLLKQQLYDRVVQNASSLSEDTLLTNARHLNALKKVLEALQDIREGMDRGLSGDLITPDIHRCLHYLGSITGEIQTDRDILGTIFGKFCIGK